MNREAARKKAEELVSQMTVEEMASQLRFDSPAIPRLNIPEYNWWNEGLHGFARSGTATSFPQAIGLGATFDTELLGEVGEVVSTEARAKYNEYTKHEDRDIYKGLTIWSPNINLFRDPRWGRGQETYGEDPYLIKELALPFIKGIQGEGEHLKAAACAKHMAVHSGPESLRHSFDAKASMKDMHETYLPQFEAAVVEGEVESVMGAYNRTNGEPCCAHSYLMGELLRGKWGFKGHFVSDCWALRDFHENHRVTSNIVESAALALKEGCDLNCGCTYITIEQGLRDGRIDPEDVKRSAINLFTTRYLLGLNEETEYDSIPYEKVECEEHLKIAGRATAESIVLLKNDGILPLSSDKVRTIGVIGPNASSRDALIGNYYGTSSEYITPLQGIIDEAGKEGIRVLYSEGCHLFKDRPDNLARPMNRISEAQIVAEHSDVVVLCLGLDATIEGEEGDTGNQFASGDKIDLKLPAPQRLLVEKVLETGTPVIVLMLAGSAMDLDLESEKAKAILQCWYPGARGGREIAQILFGKINPSGKLPVTIYRGDDELPEFTDYSMKGRTYRYMRNEAMYPFGFGLKYTKTAVKSAEIVEGRDIFADSSIEGSVKIKATVSNEGSLEAREVVEVYARTDSADEPLNPKLVAFASVKLPADGTKDIEIDIPYKNFTTVDNDGVRALRGTKAEIWVGISQPDERSRALLGTAPVKLDI